jgi:hypothetical protein
VPSTAGPGNTSQPARRPSSSSELQRLEAEARYHRDRLALYRARVMSARPTSPGRLRELERISAAADARLHRARDG